MFAIAFDAASGQQSNATASTNPALSHTCTGTNLVLTAWETGDTPVDTVTSITYNSVSMSITDRLRYPSDRWIYSAILVNPATGANNIASNGNVFGGKAGMSYTGCKQSGQPDSHSATNGSASTTATGTTTVVATGCWLTGYQYGDFLSVISGTTQRGTSAGSGIPILDSNGTVGTGAQSLSVNQNSSIAYVFLIQSISPLISGPTNVKTWDGITQSTGIKTYNSVLTASVKTVDGIT